MKKAIFRILVAAIAASLLPGDGGARDGGLHVWAAYARTAESSRLLEWTRGILREELSGIKCTVPGPPSTPAFYGRHGLFVTLIHRNKVRGCYGAFYHKSDDIARVLRDYLCGALYRDPRYRTLEAAESEDTRIVITVTGSRFPVNDPDTLDIAREGVAVTLDDNRQMVFVPAEIRSTAYLKSRLPREGVVQITGFRAVTLR